MAAPIKVDEETDAVITQAAHFLGMTKKAFVSEAVYRLATERRSEIEQGVRAAAALLDGTLRAEVGVLTGLSGEELHELGGVEE